MTQVMVILIRAKSCNALLHMLLERICKGKVIPLQAQCGPELYSYMTAALEVGEWSAACPGRTLPPGKTQYPFYRGLAGLQGRSGRVENLVPTRIQTQTVQPIVSHYTV